VAKPWSLKASRALPDTTVDPATAAGAAGRQDVGWVGLRGLGSLEFLDSCPMERQN